MSTETKETEVEPLDLDKATKAQLAAEYKATQADIKALEEAGGDDLSGLTSEQADTLGALLDYRDTVKGRLDAMPSPGAVKARIGAGDDFIKAVKRPAMGGKDAPGTGTAGPFKAKGGDDARIFAGESEDDKFLGEGGDFKGLGHFISAVKAHPTSPHRVYGDSVLGRWNTRVEKVELAIKSDPAVKAISGLGEFSDPEGGAFVPPTISNVIWERVVEELALLQFFDTQVVSGNTYQMTAWNDKSRTSGILYGGGQAYWIPEGGDFTPSKPATRNITHRLKKLGVLMYITEELAEDAVGLENRLNRVAAACITDRLNEAFITGDGSAQPLGLLNAGCKITQTAVSGQGANTVVARNILDMWSSRAPGMERTAIWLYNIGVEPQLDSMYLPTGSTVGSLVYLQPPGLSGGRYSTLRGRPAIECEYCPALGTEGDVILVDPKAYLVTLKSSGIRQAISMHVRFLQDEQTLKWSFRVDGRPYWDSALTPAKGNSRSPIVTLNASRT